MPTAVKRMSAGVVAVIGFAILLSVSAQAQPMRMSTEERVKSLKDSLKLTDEQAAKIKTILEQQSKEMIEIFGKYADNRDSMRIAMWENIQKTDNNVNPILTKSQAKKYEAMMKERRRRMGMLPK
jgi:periplasmic protein CpxP/Spy